MQLRILVTDAEQRAALAIVRALGGAGHQVVVCSARAHPLAAASRHALAADGVADPLAMPDAFVDDVAAIVRRHRINVLLPVSEAALLAVLAARERLRGVTIPFPPLETFRAACDKAHVLREARALGIRTPEQRVIASPEASRGDLPSVQSWPVVLKPARSVSGNGTGLVKHGVTYASDVDDLRRQLAAFPAEAYPVLLQQRVTGRGIGIFLLVQEGRVVARFAHQRLREKPPSGGVSVYSESVPFDEALGDLSRRLLERLGWSGVAMIEFKRDDATGEPYLMEINGRFWGSLQLAIDAGVNFPLLLVEGALGRTPSVAPAYRTGIRNRWWWGDVDHLLIRMRGRLDASALPADAPPRRRVLLDFMRIRGADRNEILRLDDPVPFLRESAQWLLRR